MKICSCNLIVLTILPALFSCNQNLHENHNPATTVHTSEMMQDYDNSSRQLCKLTRENLDTTSVLQGKIIQTDSYFKNFSIISSHRNDNLEILAYLNENDSTTILAFTEILNSKSKKNKILGILNFGKLKPFTTFQSLCSCNCNIDNEITGMIEFDDSDNTTTLKAWTINTDKKELEIVEASNVDCNDSYNADFN